MANSVFIFPGNINFAGKVTVNTLLAGNGSASAPSIAFTSQPGIGIWLQGGNTIRFSQTIIDMNGGWWELVPASQTFTMYNSGSVNWSSTNVASGSVDLSLFRDAANTLAQRNGTNAQTFRIYNTYTDASNYERGFARWNSNVFEVGAEALGTGIDRSLRLKVGNGVIQFMTNAIGRWNIDQSGNFAAVSDNTYDIGASAANRPRDGFFAGKVLTGAVTVATLPAAATALKGARYFVTDANATTFQSIVAGGGANNVPVFCDGTNWRIG